MKQLERDVIHYINEQKLVKAGDRLLIACSGGVDSMALLTFFDKKKELLNVHIEVVHVDHMLRGEQSAKDRQFVEEFCEHRQINCHSEAINIPQILAVEKGNSQTICRRERYRYIAEVALNIRATKVVTAHHADDQLESMLMGITHAISINRLKGIQPKRDFENISLIRPFLCVTKSQIGEYLQNNHVSYREDSSNEKDDYTRNRYRHIVVPFLKEENPYVSTNAVKIAQQLQDDEQFLYGMAQSKFEKLFQKNNNVEFKVEIMAFQNEAISLQRRLILILLNYLYIDTKVTQNYSLQTLILNLFKSQEGNKVLHLPDGVIARRQYQDIIFEKHFETVKLASQEIIENEWIKFGKVAILLTAIANKSNFSVEEEPCYYFALQEINLPLIVRSRMDGDRMTVAGMHQQKKVARIFIDEKIPSVEREAWPLLVDANQQILAVLGVRVNNKIATKQRDGDDYALIIRHL